MNAAVLQPVQEILAQKIQVKNLNFYYGGFHALKDINLQIPEKRVTAFIGPSGCGKSTLLRVLNRMYALYPYQRAEGELWEMVCAENPFEYYAGVDAAIPTAGRPDF